PAVAKTDPSGGAFVEGLEIVGLTKDGNVVSFTRFQAASGFGLEIAGEQALGANRIVDLERGEIRFEKSAGAYPGGFLAHLQPVGAPAAKPYRPRKCAALADDLGAGAAEGIKRLVMLLPRPARNRGIIRFFENRLG